MDRDGPPVAKKRKLYAPISPPPRREPRAQTNASSEATNAIAIDSLAHQLKVIPSPFQLTAIQDLPPALNVDTVTLKELLRDPLIKECWDFNYLHDIDFLLNAFDPDVKDLVAIKVIHGFWKREDRSRIALQVGP